MGDRSDSKKRAPLGMFHEDERTHTRGKIVELTERDVQDARRLLSLLSSEVPLAANREDHKPATRHYSLARKANAILVERRRRAEAFGTGMFGEPAWDILLLLYVVDSGPRQTIGALSKLAGVTKSTGLRWLEYLEGRQFVRRQSHPTDKRSAFVELTAEGRASLEAFLSETFIFKE